MPLPILQPGRDLSADDLVRLFHRTELHWTRHLSEEAVLECGVALTSPQLPRVFAANVVFDAALPPGGSPEAALAEADAHFAACGVRCAQWTMNPAAPRERTEPLVAHLVSAGWTTISAHILHLSGAPLARPGAVPGLTILPARASYRHARQLAEMAAAGPWGEPQLAEVAMLHLDDPHWDALIALIDGQVVAGTAVLAVGDVGRIDSVYVAPAFRRRGIGRAMMARAFDICARSLFRHVMLEVDPANAPAQALYQQLGFRKIGQMISCRAPWTAGG